MQTVIGLVLCLIPQAAPAAPGEPDFGSPGAYPVGVRTVVLVDTTRQDEFAGGPRTLVTEIWYPAADGARNLPRTRFSQFFGPYRKEAERVLRRDLESLDRDFRTLAVRDAPLREGSWPLLIFSHGNGGFRHQNAFQMDHLASHGYLVAAPDHTGNAGLTPLPERAVLYDKKGRGRSAQDRPRDVRFLLDRLIAADRSELSWLKRAVDPGAVGLLGHSFGGFTAVRAVEDDVRIKAILPMTVAFVGRPGPVPTLVMLGAQDATVGSAGNVVSRGYYLGCTGPHYLFVLKRGGHFTFSEMALIDPDFGDGIGHGKALDQSEMDFIPTPLAKEAINAYSLAFFDRHLRGREAAARFLEGNHYPAELEWSVGSQAALAGPDPRPGKEAAPAAIPAKAARPAGGGEEAAPAAIPAKASRPAPVGGAGAGLERPTVPLPPGAPLTPGSPAPRRARF